MDSRFCFGFVFVLCFFWGGVNGISIFMGYLMLNSSLQLDSNGTHQLGGRIKEIIRDFFPIGICSRLNVLTQMNFVLAYHNVSPQHVCHNVTVIHASWTSFLLQFQRCCGLHLLGVFFSALKSLCKYLQFLHHHHVVPLARISLTLSRHFSLSFIASGRSSELHPVSSHSCCMYVRAGRPAFVRPYVGVHWSTSLISSYLLLQQCLACLVRLTWIVFVMGGRWPYSWCFVGCFHQDLPGLE